jgi:hypothetical protein
VLSSHQTGQSVFQYPESRDHFLPQASASAAVEIDLFLSGNSLPAETGQFGYQANQVEEDRYKLPTRSSKDYSGRVRQYSAQSDRKYTTKSKGRNPTLRAELDSDVDFAYSHMARRQTSYDESDVEGYSFPVTESQFNRDQEVDDLLFERNSDRRLEANRKVQLSRQIQFEKPDEFQQEIQFQQPRQFEQSVQISEPQYFEQIRDFQRNDAVQFGEPHQFEREVGYRDSRLFREPNSFSFQESNHFQQTRQIKNSEQQFQQPQQFEQRRELVPTLNGNQPKQSEPFQPSLSISFDEPDAFENSITLPNIPSFLPTPLPDHFSPPYDIQYNFTPLQESQKPRQQDQHPFSKVESRDGNGYLSISNLDKQNQFPEPEYYQEPQTFPQTTEAQQIETTQKASPPRSRQLLTRKRRPQATQTHRDYEDSTAQPSHESSTRQRSRSRSRSRFRQKTIESTESSQSREGIPTSPSTVRSISRQRQTIRRRPRIEVERVQGQISQPENTPQTVRPRAIPRHSVRPRPKFETNSVPDTPRKSPRIRSRFRSRVQSSGDREKRILEKNRLAKSSRLQNNKLKAQINRLPQSPRRIDLEENDIAPPREKSISPVAYLKFPKRNLFPNLPKVKFADKTDSIHDNVVRDSGRLQKSSQRKTHARLSQEIRPTRTIVKPDLNRINYDYDNVNIQSTRDQEEDGYITVTHRASVPTVYTIIEDRETKKLYAEFKTTSLQIVDVNDLTSTNVNGIGVVYAHVVTSQPQFGIKEYHFDAIHPTTTEHYIESRLTVGGTKTNLISTVLSTYYNVETVTARVTETPTVDIANNLSSPPAAAGLQVLVQNILANLLGKNLFNKNILGGAHQAASPQTHLVTHTRSYLTSSISTQTIVIPITLRGQEVFKTVTDKTTVTETTTDYSVQTVTNYVSSKPPSFLPLAPTLHRATRVVPSLPVINPLILLPSFTKEFLTHTVSSTTTVTKDATSNVVITLGGREVHTNFIQPTTQVVILTSYSTETVTRPATRHNNIEATRTLADILKNIKLLQYLRND